MVTKTCFHFVWEKLVSSIEKTAPTPPENQVA